MVLGREANSDNLGIVFLFFFFVCFFFSFFFSQYCMVSVLIRIVSKR